MGSIRGGGFSGNVPLSYSSASNGSFGFMVFFISCGCGWAERGVDGILPSTQVDLKPSARFSSSPELRF